MSRGQTSGKYILLHQLQDMSRGQTSGKYILLHQLQDMSRGQTSGNSELESYEWC